MLPTSILSFEPAHPVLFVGSSSIRFWPTAELFPGLPVINLPALFVEDGLYLSEAGYDLWTDVLAPVLDTLGPMK